MSKSDPGPGSNEPNGSDDLPRWLDRLGNRYHLSRREREVLRWVADAKSDFEISIILAISTRTVNHHVSRILNKLGVENRVAASRIAFEAEMEFDGQ